MRLLQGGTRKGAMTAEQHKEFLNFALSLAKAAEEQLMPRYRNCAASQKTDGSDVTEADLAAEKAMRQMIARRYPHHAVLGEELGVMGETVYAARGLGCWFKAGDSTPTRVHVSASVPLKDATVSAAGVHGSDIYLGDGETPYNLTALIRQARKFRFCGDCLQHALVCRGRIHAAVDTIMQPWDSAAIITCVEEAGGLVTMLTGERDGAIFGGSLVSSCGESLHREIVALAVPVALHDGPQRLARPK